MSLTPPKQQPAPEAGNSENSVRLQLVRFFQALGPGIVTGAADDDPSGIGTYTVAGAQFGTSLLWSAFLTWPLMAFVQMMCARIGMVTGEGLTASLKKKFPRPVILLFCGLLFIANTLNIGADLAAMADAAELLTGWSSRAYGALFSIVFGIGITIAIIKLHYRQIAKSLTWLALFLFAYVINVFLVAPDWHSLFKISFVPSLPKSSDEWGMLVAILGTTISPYLFFWQAAEEVEEAKCRGHASIRSRVGATREELINRRFDVGIGTFFSNIVMYFIILATALTLYKNGVRNVETSRQAAEALRPFAGGLSATVYTIGLLGVGFLAIPTLAGSAAYAFSETMNWRQGLDQPHHRAPAFYAVIVGSMAVAILLTLVGFNPIKALYWSAVANGLLAPFLILGILVVAKDKKAMQDQTSSRLSLAVVSLTMILMFAAAVGMFIT